MQSAECDHYSARGMNEWNLLSILLLQLISETILYNCYTILLVKPG